MVSSASHSPRYLALAAAALTLAACQAEDEQYQFRASTYTTNSTLSDSGSDSGGPVCEPDEVFDVNVRRSLFETHPDALVAFDMHSVLDAIAANSGLQQQAATIHDQIMDTFNPGPGLGLGAHCDDDTASTGGPGLNGFPLQCGRAEGLQVGNIDEWFPVSAVNRFDLAPSDGANCGEARIVMANRAPIGPSRAFMIFEAKIPNPNPGCGLDACQPVQQFWADLTHVDDLGERGDQLRQAFLDGHPDLQAAGFGPFFSQQAFGFGQGQVRTNTFNQGPWTLREFKAVAVKKPAAISPFAAKPAVASGLLRFVPVPVAANPFGALWNDTTPVPQSKKCREELIGTVGSLMADDVNLMGVDVPLDCLAAESPDSPIMDYSNQLVSGSKLEIEINSAIQTIDPGSTLTADHIANRALFAGGCIGCHQRSKRVSNRDLGNGITAPNSLLFTHTDEVSTEDCGDGQAGCFLISDALKDDFLPHRKAVMDTFLNNGPCCEAPSDEFEPAEPVLPTPMAELDVQELIETEAAAKAAGAPQTIGGSPSLRAH